MRRQSTPQQVRSQYGFTLLELLLVVFILSVLAVSAVSLTDNLDTAQDQYRVEATKNQGSAFEKGIINISADGRSISGFVADMGALPSNMMELAYGVRDLATPLRFPGYQLVHPVFDPTPTFGFNDGSADSITISSMPLGKGYRGQLTTNAVTEFFHGSYINLGMGSTTDYKSDGAALFQDGWGNGSISGFYTVDGLNQSPTNGSHTLTDLTHGWQLAAISDASYAGENFFGDVPTANGVGAITLSSSGRNGAVDGENLYDADQVVSRIQPDDWSVFAGDIRVEVFNDLPEANVFENQSNANGFTYRAFLLACNARATDNPVDGDPFKWKWAQFPSANFHVHIPRNSSRIFTLKASDGGPRRIPAGEHIVLLARCDNIGNPIGTTRLPAINFPAVYVRTIQDGDGSSKNEIQQIRMRDGALTGLDGPLSNPSTFRLFVDRDNAPEQLIASSFINFEAAKNPQQTAIYDALTEDQGPATIIDTDIDDVSVTPVAPSVWNVEFKFGKTNMMSENDAFPDIAPMQIDPTMMVFNWPRFYLTRAIIHPSQSTTIRLNLSTYTPENSLPNAN